MDLLGDSSQQLLALPEALLGEVVSWSPDSSTANALLNTCKALSHFHSDAAAVALLLMRCSCTNYCAALTACSSACAGGLGAVTQQVLQQMGALVSSGGPHTAPVPLLQALLYAEASAGNTPGVQALLALPQQPGIRAGSRQALRLAMQNGPHLQVMETLLDHGADPYRDLMLTVCLAACQPDRVPALRLLLNRCPADKLHYATGAALKVAVRMRNDAAAQVLLARVDAAGVDLGPMLIRAVDVGSPVMLQLLLDHRPPPPADLEDAMFIACRTCQATCVVLLLAAGADVNAAGSAPLWCALTSGTSAAGADNKRHTVQALLQAGANVTQEVLQAAAGQPGLLVLLEEAGQA